jgi:hypothetical protein
VSPAAAADRPAIAEVNAGDLIVVSGLRLPFDAVVRCITTTPRGRRLHFELPGRPEVSWMADYLDTDVVERHGTTGQAAA